jgi:hypothetical protein
MVPAHYSEMSVHSDLNGMTQDSSKLTYDCAYVSVCMCVRTAFNLAALRFVFITALLYFTTSKSGYAQVFRTYAAFLLAYTGMAEQGRILFIIISK